MFRTDIRQQQPSPKAWDGGARASRGSGGPATTADWEPPTPGALHTTSTLIAHVRRARAVVAQSWRERPACVRLIQASPGIKMDWCAPQHTSCFLAMCPDLNVSSNCPPPHPFESITLEAHILPGIGMISEFFSFSFGGRDCLSSRSVCSWVFNDA